MMVANRVNDTALPTVAELVCFDMAGTTVADGGVVEQAFGQALDRLGIGADDAGRTDKIAYVRATMGTSKIEVFRHLFATEDQAQAANMAFEGAFSDLVRAGAVVALPGAADTLATVRHHGAKVALTTGFSAETRQLILETLGWQPLVDLALSPSDVGRGRPYPDMNLAAAIQLGITDVRAVAVAGDTRSDMLAALRAGATWRVGIVSGADDRLALHDAGANYVLDSVVSLPEIVGLA